MQSSKEIYNLKPKRVLRYRFYASKKRRDAKWIKTIGWWRDRIAKQCFNFKIDEVKALEANWDHTLSWDEKEFEKEAPGRKYTDTSKRIPHFAMTKGFKREKPPAA